MSLADYQDYQYAARFFNSFFLLFYFFPFPSFLSPCTALHVPRQMPRPPQVFPHLCMYISMYIHTFIYMYIQQGIGKRRQVFAHVYVRVHTHTPQHTQTHNAQVASTNAEQHLAEGARRVGRGGGGERAWGRSRAREDDQSDHDCPGFDLDSFSFFCPGLPLCADSGSLHEALGIRCGTCRRHQSLYLQILDDESVSASSDDDGTFRIHTHLYSNSHTYICKF